MGEQAETPSQLSRATHMGGWLVGWVSYLVWGWVGCVYWLVGWLVNWLGSLMGVLVDGLVVLFVGRLRWWICWSVG